MTFVASWKLVGAVDPSGARGIEQERAALDKLDQTIKRLAAGPQMRIDAMLGISANSNSATRGADIAAYGEELDRLRGKFNPAYAAIRQYRSALTEIRQAHSVGAISTKEMTAAIDRERTATLASIAAIKQRNAALSDRGAVGNFQTANIAAQFQDVFVTAGMGMNPLQIGLQQGTQLSAVLQSLKAEGQGTGAALRQAFLSVVSPMSLVTVGAIALGAAVVQWLGPMLFKAESATAALERHRTAITALVDGYDKAEAAANDYFDRQAKRPAGAVASDLGAQLRQFEEARKALANLGSLTAAGGNSEALSLPLREAILDFDRGEISARQLYERVVEIRNTDMSPFKWAMSGVYGSLEDAALKAGDLHDQLIGISHILAGLGHNEGVQVALDSMLAGDRSAEAHQIEMDAINAKTPAQMADIARRRMALDLADQQITESLRQQRIDQAGALAYAQASRAMSDGARSRLLAANDNLASAQVELQLIGKSIGETERLRWTRQQLASAEMEAARAGTTVSAEHRAEIERLGKAYGDLQQAIALAKVQGDIKFDRSQIFRTEDEAEIAQQLRTLFGDDLTSAQADFVAGQLRVNQSLTTTKELLGGIVGGVLSDLKTGILEGASAFDILGRIGSNALNKLADQALSMAGQGIVNLLMGALFGSAGLNFTPTTTRLDGLPLVFDGGGDTGNGPRSGGLDGKGGMLAMVHPQETIIDRYRGQSAGQTSLQVTYAPVYQIGAGASRADIERADRESQQRFRRMLPGMLDDVARRAS